MARTFTLFCLLAAAAIFAPTAQGNVIIDVQRKIASTIEHFLNVTATVTMDALKVQAKAEEELLNVFQDVQDRIVQLQHDESKVVCGVRATNEYKEVVANLTKGIANCTASKVSSAKEVVDSVVDLFRRLNATLEEAEQRIEDCKKNTVAAIAVACQTQEEAKALQDVLPVVYSSFETLVKVNRFMMSIMEGLMNCPKPYMAAARTAEKQIKGHIDQCVADLSA
ncbi:uncharacterized protein [Anabrus simplex]|uniref:uncharacterized protein n=1 Tax=Anabrus simplex TaxID=316456 RepID=UPI0035A2B560